MIGNNKAQPTGRQGFTLVEMLVSFAIFSIVIGISTGVFASMIKSQKYSLDTNQLLNQTSYFVEYMSRAIRMAVKDEDDSTCGFSGDNYQITGNKIKFRNYQGECQEFYLTAGILMVNKTSFSSALALSSDDFDISALEFNVIGISGSDNLQPRITFSFKITGNSAAASNPTLNIQTSISQRNLDI